MSVFGPHILEEKQLGDWVDTVRSDISYWAGGEEPAVSEGPVGSGMNVGGAHFNCRPTAVPLAALLGAAEFKCMTHSEAIGLASALGRTIKVVLHGISGTTTVSPGTTTDEGIMRTPATPDEARAQALTRIYDEDPSGLPSWVEPVAVTAGVVSAVGIGLYLLKRFL